MTTLLPYINMAKSITQLFQPLVEVVIHDLKTQTIAYIEGGLSKRKIGDPSLLESTEDWDTALDGAIYHKLNHDGKLLKSTTIPLQNEGETIALMCLNYDVSLFQEIQKMATMVLAKPLDDQPQSLFKNDWQERIHLALHKLLSEKGQKIHTLTFDDKKEMIQLLYQMGAFKGRKATDYVAEILGMGRATIFKYLKHVKSMHNHDESF